MATKKFSYKESLKEIETIVHKIENEQIDVDELSSMVKKAADLIKLCRTKLRDTESELDEIIEKLDE
ncbi:MAG: exodeoxyribonuclease VII small subunit [Cytophagales bacterium]|nr:exodeoxyribonuclease VII small subunit [Cytophagales bacterium]